uniref:Uncharacterized protein n=1 Tax=Meloidogyne enterolobii TaxID=390850 RepID=A0A6V7YAZ9_MELEN|nr:unnamed protein product [Meloidogyne enterolobii]
MSLPNSSHKLTDPPFLKKKKPLHRFRLSYLRVISKGTGCYSIGVDSFHTSELYPKARVLIQ